MALGVLAALVRLLYLTEREISLDEPFSLYHAQGSIDNILGLMPNENNPPIHFLLLHFWMKWLGNGVWMLRFSSAVFSILSVSLYFFGLNKLFNFKLAAISSLLLLFSNSAIFYAHDIRAYSLLLFLFMLNFFSFFTLTISTSGKKHSILFIISGILMLYTHFISVVYFLSLALITLIINWKEAQKFKNMLWLYALLLLGFLPYLSVFFTRLTATEQSIGWLMPPVPLDLYWILRRFTNQGGLALFAGLGLVMHILFYLWQKKRFQTADKVLLLFGLFFLLLSYIISLKIPVFHERYLLLFLPIWLALISRAFLEWINAFAALKWPAMGLLLFYLFKSDLHGNDHLKHRETALLMKTHQSNGGKVIICPPWWNKNLAYHAYPEAFKDYGKLEEHLERMGIYSVYKASDLPLGFINKSDSLLVVDGGMALTDVKGELSRELEKAQLMPSVMLITPTFESRVYYKSK